MTRTNEHKSVVPRRAVQASGRGTETPQRGRLLAVPLFPGSGSEIKQIRVKEKKNQMKEKKRKGEGPPKGETKSSEGFGDWWALRAGGDGGTLGTVAFQDTKTGKNSSVAGFSLDHKMSTYSPHPLKDKAQAPERIRPAEPPLSRSGKESIYDGPQ